jgi:hypothetical protein
MRSPPIHSTTGRTCLRCGGQESAAAGNAWQELAGTRLDRCVVQAHYLAIYRHHDGTMKLYAISNLHVGYEPNRDLWSALGE